MQTNLSNERNREIKSLMTLKFWWGQEVDHKKIHWLEWSWLCQPKAQGGLGFHELRMFNKELLGKQVRRLLHKYESLLYRVFKAKFFPNGIIMNARDKQRGSFAWKSILQAHRVINHGVVWRVGNGRLIKPWNHSWLPEKSYRCLISSRNPSLEDITKFS